MAALFLTLQVVKEHGDEKDDFLTLASVIAAWGSLLNYLQPDDGRSTNLICPPPAAIFWGPSSIVGLLERGAVLVQV